MEYKSFAELKEYIERADRPIDIARVKEAYDLAVAAHGGQRRVSGEPYVIHPIETAFILIDLGMDTECICAGLLHDVVEDTPVTLDEILSLIHI